ncbi:MAG TPA: amidase [Ktedonobacteraceae bacterium]|jgi:aspartyl-tRNA(Asn)/glutamyl-tRNA(Gln) amidotransferase subunit A
MTYLSIQEAYTDLRSGLVTPTELLSEMLEQIEARDGQIQAFVTLLREEAFKEAEKAEREQRTGLFRSSLHGIPLAIKDLVAVKHARMTAGSRVLADYIAPEDATVVEQLRRAGAVIVGKTNTHEFAYGTYTPPTRNPWDVSRVPGGSSGGSAAALAASMCLGAIGSDTGGSIRIPAACCGVTGLKPTYGRVSCSGVVPLSWSLDHVGPLGRSAEDCAIIFDCIAAYDPRDPNSVSHPPGQTHTMLSGEHARGPLSLQGLTLGIPQDDAVDPLDPEVRQAWRSAVLVLKEAGIQIREVRLPCATMELYRLIQKPEATLAHVEKGWLTEKAELYSQLTRTRLLDGLQITAVDYLRAQQQRRTFAGSLRAALQPVDALLLPAQPMPAIQISQIGQQITLEGRTEAIGDAMLRLTMPFNLAGLPALAFPCGFNALHLPCGLQVVGKPFEEGLILHIVHAYQQLTDWHRRVPHA